MRASVLALTLSAAALAPPAFAQAVRPPMPLKIIATSAEVQAAMAKAQASRKPGALMVIEPLASVPPYRYNLEYRFEPNLPSIHEKDNEIFYFVQGSGMITLGGTLVDPKRTNATNVGGTAIQGGAAPVSVSKGDLFIVPAGTPHILQPVGGPLVDIVIRQTVAAPAVQ